MRYIVIENEFNKKIEKQGLNSFFLNSRPIVISLEMPTTRLTEAKKQMKMRTKKEKITSINVCSHIDSAIAKAEYDVALDLVRRFKASGYTMTASRIKKEFELSNKEISTLNYQEADNPYYKCSGPMKLYLIGQVKHLLLKKQSLQ